MTTTDPHYADIPRVAIQVSRNMVVASIQTDLTDAVLAQFRDDLLRTVHATDSNGVILDVSGLETLDSTEFAGLRQLITMCTIMGTEAVLVGLRPGVVSSLIEANADIDGLNAAISLDAAYALLEPTPEPEPEATPQAADNAAGGDAPEPANSGSPVEDRA